MRRATVILLTSILLVGVSALPADAGGGVGLPMNFTTMCQYGERAIVWTLTNDAFGPDDDITVETFDLITVPTGPTLTTTTFEPQPIPRWSTAEATTRLPGTYLGEVRGSISVRGQESGGGAQRQVPTVVLSERCPGVGGVESTTTTVTTASTSVSTSTTTTTSQEAPPPAVRSEPRFTG